jgi:hypothetical protein
MPSKDRVLDPPPARWSPGPTVPVVPDSPLVGDRGEMTCREAVHVEGVGGGGGVDLSVGEDRLSRLVGVRGVVERRRWFHKRGSDQWNPDRAFATRMANSVDRRETLLFRDDGVSIATVTVIPEGDFRTPDELKEPALYLGKDGERGTQERRGPRLPHALVGARLGSTIWLRLIYDGTCGGPTTSSRTTTGIGGRYLRTVHAAHR